MSTVQALLREWDGEDVVLRFDRDTGAWIIIAIHSTRLGPATGGTRMKGYGDLSSGLRDALRLAHGMTYKWAVMDFPRGGGKGVIALTRPVEGEARRHLLRRYGSLIKQLGGLYRTGPDVGTSAEDMDVIAGTGAPYVHSRTQAAGGAGDSGPFTALGLFHAIRVTVLHGLSESSLQGMRVAVQGAGSVGRRAIDRLVDGGADVVFCDVDRTAVRRVESETGARAVSPDDIYEVPCDVFAPCALGGTLNRHTIPRLRCRAVVGAANNQLASDRDAARMQRRGILYVPDFVANMGGAMGITGMEAMGWSRRTAEERVTEGISAAVERVLAPSRDGDIDTVAAARRLAEERLAAAR